MQINEVFALSLWYVNNVTNKSPTTLLNGCINELKHAQREGRANESIINAFRKNILSFLNELDHSSLTENQKNWLNYMGLKSLLLDDATSYFELLLNPSMHDTNFFITILGEHLNTYVSADSSFSQCHILLPKIVGSETLLPISVPEGKVLTRLTFHNDASINNLVEFNNWAKSWNFIARGFAMAIDEAPEDFEIVNADRGSFIIDLLICAGAMKILFEALKAFTDFAISITDLTTKLKQIKGLKNVVSDDVYKQFVAEVKANIETEENRIVDKVIDKLYKEGIAKNLNSRNDLSKAIKEMHKFNSHGGSIRCLTSNDDTFDTESVKQLNESYKQLQHQSELKLIEHNDN